MDILLADDHAATRKEIAALVEAQDDLDVVGQAADGEEAVCLAKQLDPDLIVTDIVMPGMNGIKATEAIRAFNPNARILVLSNHTGKDLIETILHAGATGYVPKARAYEQLIPAIRAVANGEQYIDSDVSV